MYQGILLFVVRVSFAFSLLIAISASAQAVTLAWKFSPGEKQNYRVLQSAKLSAGPEDDVKQFAAVEQELELTWKVLEVNDDGSAHISLQVSAFSFLAEGPDGQEVRYDSDSTEEPQGYAAMLLPIGKRLNASPVTLTMSPRGAVSDVKIADELSEAVKSVPGGKKFAQDGGLKSFETLALLGAPVLMPEGDIATGARWLESREITFPVLGQIKAEFAYVLRNPINPAQVTIEQMMSINITEAEGVERLKLVDQSSTGTMVFDVENGRPENSTLTYEAKFDQPNSAEGNVKLEHSIEFRRVADDSQ